MQPFSAAAAFGCVQAHDSDYVSVYVHDHVHFHEGSDIADVFVGILQGLTSGAVNR